MADEVEGYVVVYEASDGGSGDPRKTVWQFFVDATPMTTTNPELAATARLAIESHRQVKATVEQGTVLQIRIAYQPPTP